MRIATVTLTLTVLVVSGCGGASAKDYRAALDKECAAGKAFNQSLPQRQHDQDLTVAQIQAIADAHARQSRERVRKLDHPGDLDDEAAALDKVTGEVPKDSSSPAGAIAYFEKLKTAYADIGATGCVSVVASGIAQFRSLPTPTVTP